LKSISIYKIEKAYKSRKYNKPTEIFCTPTEIFCTTVKFYFTFKKKYVIIREKKGV